MALKNVHLKQCPIWPSENVLQNADQKKTNKKKETGWQRKTWTLQSINTKRHFNSSCYNSSGLWFELLSSGWSRNERINKTISYCSEKKVINKSTKKKKKKRENASLKNFLQACKGWASCISCTTRIQQSLCFPKLSLCFNHLNQQRDQWLWHNNVFGKRQPKTARVNTHAFSFNRNVKGFAHVTFA